MFKTKTFWAAMTAIVGAIGGYSTGELEAGSALQVVVTSVLAVFLRQGVLKGESATATATATATAAAVEAVVKAAPKAPQPKANYDYSYDYTYRG